jgi:hypothetical protein
MLRCEATTTLAPAVALAVAEQFFGASAGLAVRRREPQALLFEGNDGHVRVSIIHARPTTLEIETSEWETWVTEFMDRLPR